MTVYELLNSLEALALGGRKVPAKRVHARLDFLGTLSRGWFNGDGDPPSTLALQKARKIVNFAEAESLSQPWVYPIETGGLCLDWDTYEVDLYNDGRIALFELRQVGDPS